MLPGKRDCMSVLSKEFLSFLDFSSGLLRKSSRLKKEMQPRNPPLCPLVISFVYISQSNGCRRVICHCVTVGTYKFFKIHFNNANSTCLYSFQLLYLCMISFYILFHLCHHAFTLMKKGINSKYNVINCTGDKTRDVRQHVLYLLQIKYALLNLFIYIYIAVYTIGYHCHISHY